jgi:NAD(P)-dependent dehydrogenase (short-subunit alcohol dehydrogenase family)
VYATARKRGSEWKIGQINPLKRGGNADEVARVALFLASDEYYPPCWMDDGHGLREAERRM